MIKMYYKFLTIILVVGLSNSLKLRAEKSCEDSIPNCIKCDFEKKDCIECETSFFITQDNQCGSCMEGCLQCYKKENCVKCHRFFEKDKLTGSCNYSYTKLIPYFFIVLFLMTCVILSFYWICLKCRNKRNLKLLKRKTVVIGGDKLSTAFLSKQSSRGRTRDFSGNGD